MTLARFQRFVQTAGEAPVQDTVHTTGRAWTDHVVAGLKAVGLSAVIATGLLGTTPGWAAESVPAWQATYLNEAQTVLGQAVRDGMLDRMPQVSITAPQDGESMASRLPGTTCHIDWQIDAQGRSESLDPAATGPDSMVAGTLYRETSLLHEAGHCELATIAEPLRNTGLPPTTEKAINQWVLGPNAVSSPFGAQFNESGADCLGLIETLAQQKFSPESIAHLHAWYDARRNARLTLEKAGRSWDDDPHMTDFAIHHLIDHLDEVRQASPDRYQDLALTYASQGFMDWINPLRPMVSPAGALSTAGPEALEALVGGFETGSWFGMDVGYQMTLIKAEQDGALPALSGPRSDPRRMAEQFLAADRTFASIPNARVVRFGTGLTWRNVTTPDMKQLDERLKGPVMNDVVERWKTDHEWPTMRDTLYSGLGPGYLQAAPPALATAPVPVAPLPTTRDQAMALALAVLKAPHRQDLVKKLDARAPDPAPSRRATPTP